MSTPFNFDGYSEFCDWCSEHGYDPDTQYDLESESHKRNTYDSFYVKKIDGETYAEVSVETSYDYGWQEGEISCENLQRVVELVTTEKIKYK